MVTVGTSVSFTVEAAVALNAPLGVVISNTAYCSQTYDSGQSSVGFTTVSSTTESINVDPGQTTTQTLVTADGILTITIPASPTLPVNAVRLVYTRLAAPSVPESRIPFIPLPAMLLFAAVDEYVPDKSIR